MILIDKEKCIGCGMCVNDCCTGDIKIFEGGKAEPKNKNCIDCFHCIAVCPKNAICVINDKYTMDEVTEYTNQEFNIDSERLLNFIRFRRSVRNFQDKEVEDEKLKKIIEAGRFTQTATNSQDVSYIVVKKKINELKSITLDTLENMGKYILDNLNDDNKKFKKYALMWIAMNRHYKSSPENDRLFYNAPSLLLITSKNEVNASLAASNMELMTNALGLGTFFCGFLIEACRNNDKIGDMLGLKNGDKIVNAMVIGYPKVKYKRTVPRKKANILWD